MEIINTSAQNQNIIEYPKKKYLDEKQNAKDLDTIHISTNLTRVELNQEAIKGVFLFGCDLEEESQVTEEFNPVNIMSKARKYKCFQEEIKKYVTDYYISGLILMGKPKIEERKFKFYLKIKEEVREILESKPKFIEKDVQLYKFKFKRKKKDLYEMGELKESGDAQCVAYYLNICLGKVLKKCGYAKERSSRKILYINNNYRIIKNSNYLCFPALKAVCEAYEGGKIFMKLLPKKVLMINRSCEYYFNSIKAHTAHNVEEVLEEFKKKIVNKRAIKTYDQAFIKIDDVIFKNPFSITFKDKKNNEWTVGDYYNQYLQIKIKDEEMPIAVRIIDKGGKLKGDDRLFIHIPCSELIIIGNVFGDKIDINITKKMIQKPDEKYDEINYIRGLIEDNALNSKDTKDSKDAKDTKLHNYLGDKFDPITLEGQVIKPPLIQFGNNKIVEPYNGNFEMIESSPYNDKKELEKIDIYLLNLDSQQGEMIWKKLKEASKSLGITFKEDPNLYELKYDFNLDRFKDYLYGYFQKCDKYYSNKDNKTDFIFMFMDKQLKNSFHYRVFKSVINEFNWHIPTQVILFDDIKLNFQNLSQFTNILCQMWAKKGKELYTCDFSFIKKTLVVAYSSMVIQDKKILTSICISKGTKLFEYVFYSKVEENKSEEYRISPSIEYLLTKALIYIGKDYLDEDIENIVIYRDAVNERQQKLISFFEKDSIQKAIKAANEKLEEKIFENTKWCLILVSKINDVKMFSEEKNKGINYNNIQNIPTGTIIDKIITHKDKYDFYLNSADSKQGTCSSTHYTVLYDDTKLEAIQIYKLTYYLTYLSYNTTHCIRVPSPLYFVTRRNKFTF